MAHRRILYGFIGIVFIIAFCYSSPAYTQDVFNFETVSSLAENLVKSEYQPPNPLPDIVKNLSYDQWRSIRQKPEKAYWKGGKTDFNLQFFHPGFVYDRSVEIHIVQNGKIEPLGIKRDWFDFSGLPFAPQIPEHIGAAGFRVHSPIKDKTYFDEFLVFLGGSYLRAVGKNDQYGLSARGLAIDTALAKGEEFPWFREFWVETPGPKDKSIVIYALLDSPSVAGAYRFVATPGDETSIEVQCRLFFRDNVEKLGLAPLTSMYFFGENNRKPGVNDFRPEVHDSDGLQILFDNGEWLWRPLNNPRYLQVNSFSGTGFKGFGLLQRDRDYHSYEDLEAYYHQRPSLWIEPTSDWGSGKVELIQIPTKDEIHDNIVAYWVPDAAVMVGDIRDFSYRMRWGSAEQLAPPAAKVIATRMTLSEEGTVRRFVVDFDGPALQEMPGDSLLSAVVNCSEGAEVRNITVHKNNFNKSWRLSFELIAQPVSTLEKVLPDNGTPIEIRAFLNSETDVVSETWSYSVSRKMRL